MTTAANGNGRRAAARQIATCLRNVQTHLATARGKALAAGLPSSKLENLFTRAASAQSYYEGIATGQRRT
jgi:hypothetical protein